MRDRGQRPPQLTGYGAKLDVAKAQAAVGLGDCGAQPALLGHGLPQALVIGASRIVQHPAHHAHAATAVQEPARLAAQEFLVVGKVEIHGRPARYRCVRAQGYPPLRERKA